MDLKFSVLLKAIDAASPAINRVGRAFGGLSNTIGGANRRLGTLGERVNEASRKTAGLRQAASSMAIAGAMMGGAATAIAAPLYKSVEAYGALQDAQQHLLTQLPKGAKGMRELAEATALADKISKRFNVSQEDVLQNIYEGLSATLKFKNAMTNAVTSIEVAKGTQGDIAETGRVMAQVVKVFGEAGLKGKAATAQIKHFSDMTAYAVREKAFKNIGELNVALGESMGSAKSAGISYRQLLTTLAGFQEAGLTGTMAGEALEESLQALGRGGFQKLGVHVAKFKNNAIDIVGTLINLKKKFDSNAISLANFMKLSKDLGIRGQRAMVLNVSDLEKTRAQLAGTASAGAALGGALVVMHSMNQQLGRMNQGITQFEQTLGKQLAPTITKLADHVLALTNRLTAITKAHPAWVKFGVIAAAVSASILAVGAGLSLIGGALAGFAAFGPVIGVLVTSFGTLSSLLETARIAWMMYAAGESTATAAAWAFIASNPVGWAIAGVAALAAIGYEVYKHWSGIKRLASSMYNAGAKLVDSLAAGIKSKALEPVHAAERIASHILDFFKGHSPPPVGPLHDLNRVRIVETIADSIKPAPMLSAIRRVAQVAAVAVPVAIGAGAGVAMASSRTAASAGGAPIVLNYSPNITIHGDANPEDFRRLLRQHSYELMQTLEREHARRARTELK